jgi:hypothetical protein
MESLRGEFFAVRPKTIVQAFSTKLLLIGMTATWLLCLMRSNVFAPFGIRTLKASAVPRELEMAEILPIGLAGTAVGE